MKKYRLLAIGVAFCLSIIVGGSVFATSQEIQTLENDLQNGELIVNSIDPTGNDELFEAILLSLSTKYKLVHARKSKDDYTRAIFSTYTNDESKEITLKYQPLEASILAKVQAELPNIPDPMPDESGGLTQYTINDLPIINYIIAGYKGDADYDTIEFITGMVNFSPEYKKDIGNSNLEIEINGVGWGGSPYSVNGGGLALIKYKGSICGAKTIITSAKHVLYVPDDTEQSQEAFISAAENRIKSYLSGTEYENSFSILPTDQLTTDKIDMVENELGVTYEDGSRVIVKYGDTQLLFIIARDSSKIVNPSFGSTDILTEVAVDSDDSTIPLDTIVVVNKINNKDRSDTINKLGLKDADIYDINLHSNAADRDITKLGNGRFLVRVPVGSKYEGKNLAVYYIDVNGKVETFDVTVQNGYAVFITNHFSEYILGTTDEESTNPATIDDITTTIIAFIGLTIISLVTIKNYIKR